MNIFEHIGRYFLMLGGVFSMPDNRKVFWERFFDEAYLIIIKSIPLVLFLSFFMGGVVTIQTASNMDSPLLPEYTIGFITRQSTILEFSPTIITLIIAGKVGSNIASEIGTMRVTEQIDALDIMGVNSINYLMLPKILATTLFYPFVIVISMVMSIFGGWFAGVASGLYSTETYILGLQFDWDMVEIGIPYALTKSMVFAFLFTSIASYFGYYTKGGALEVGKASTSAVVTTAVAILLANYMLTQLILI